MPTRRDILRAAAAAAAAMVARPAAAASPPQVVAPFLRDGLLPGLGRWSGHAAPDAHLDLPARVHAVAMHPDAARCVAVARRPGRFGVAVDLARFEQSLAFESTPGRHFFGHGLFAGGGDLFLTTENDYEAGRGVIGVRDVRRGFRAVAEWPSGGVGPHDLVTSADGRTLIVANGGIDMRPDTGRAKLNEGLIASSIARIAIGSGRLEALTTLDEAMASLSIRHLAVLAEGAVAFGCQETERDGMVRPLVGIVGIDGDRRWLEPPPGGWAVMAGYVGGVAADEAGRLVAATSPLGSLCGVWDAASGRCLAAVPLADCCAVAGLAQGFVMTGGHGGMVAIDGAEARPLLQADIGFDNHLAVV